MYSTLYYMYNAMLHVGYCGSIITSPQTIHKGTPRKAWPGMFQKTTLGKKTGYTLAQTPDRVRFVRGRGLSRRSRGKNVFGTEKVLSRSPEGQKGSQTEIHFEFWLETHIWNVSETPKGGGQQKDPKVGQNGPFLRAFNRDPEDQIFPLFPLFPGQPVKSAKNTMKIHSGDTFAGKKTTFLAMRDRNGALSPPKKRANEPCFLYNLGEFVTGKPRGNAFFWYVWLIRLVCRQKGERWGNWVLRVPIKTPIKKSTILGHFGAFLAPPHFWVFHILHWSYREIHVYCVIHV